RVRRGVLRHRSGAVDESRVELGAQRGEAARCSGVSAVRVPLELLRRYNVPGPRYTSYPTAPSWREALDAPAYARILEDSSTAESPAPPPLSFPLPFCERLCYFCGCTVVITGTHHGPENPYLQTLEREIDWVAQRLGAAADGNAAGPAGRRRKVVQLHW